MTVCLLFVSGFSSHIEIFTMKWRRHHIRWNFVNFGLCSALMAIEHGLLPHARQALLTSAPLPRLEWMNEWFVLFVCLLAWGFSSYSRIFHSYIWRRHTTTCERLQICKFWPMLSATMAIEQWEFFSVPHLLWHGSSFYTGHLRGPVTLTSIAERLAVDLSLPVFTT